MGICQEVKKKTNDNNSDGSTTKPQRNSVSAPERSVNSIGSLGEEEDVKDLGLFKKKKSYKKRKNSMKGTSKSDKFQEATRPKTERNPQRKLSTKTPRKRGKSFHRTGSENDEKRFKVKASMLVTCNDQNFNNDYDILKVMGEGGYGCVWKVKQKRTGLIRAMKKIPKIKNNNNKENEIINEIETLKKLDHPNIVKIFEYYIDDKGYYLITEFCKEGELFEIIKKKGTVLREEVIANIMFQIFNAVNYCHSTGGIIHRDLKPENILIESHDNETGFFNLKIIDFGTAKITGKLSEKDKKVIGSLYYIAPEVLSGNYNEKCDIWSCGVIFYILLTGGIPPFRGSNTEEVFEKIKEGKVKFDSVEFANVSSDAKDLIKKCLHKDVSKRISALDAMNHVFFSKYDTKNFFIEVDEYFLNTTIDNLITYQPKNKLHEMALAYLVHNFPHINQIKLINKVFTLLNTSESGKLTRQEMKEGLAKYIEFKSKKELDKKVESVFKNVDNDDNGFIECEEFQRAGLNKRIFNDDKVLKFIFDFFDKDKSGEISLSELKTIFKVKRDKESEEYLKSIIKSIDIDGNGEISFEEFKHLMEMIIT